MKLLIESGHGYECFCTEKRLELMRREAAKLRQKSRYDNKCRDLTRDEVKRKKAAGEQCCIRFKVIMQQIYYFYVNPIFTKKLKNLFFFNFLNVAGARAHQV